MKCGIGAFQQPDVPFQGQDRVLVNLPKDASPFEILSSYLTPDIVHHIVLETNRYAQQYLSANAATLKPSSEARRWHDTTDDEMVAFIGLLFLMGITYKPRLSMYWNTTDIFRSPMFGQVMSRRRFLLLLRFFHFADNSKFDPKDPARDRLYKVRPLLNMIRERLVAVYYPKRELCVDESLIPFKGRISFKQFIRNKRARFGVKMYELTTDRGILLNTFIYVGNTNTDLDTTLGADMLTTERIPLSLMREYLDKGHCLFIDNFYTTPRLAKFLLDRGTTMVGTVRSNRRQFPKVMLQKGESAAYEASGKGVLAMKYRAQCDKSNKKPKEVYLITTANKNESAATNKRAADGSVVMKPQCILSYNRSMGGIDMIDQQLETLHFLRRSYKWYRKVAIRLLLHCLLNSHKIYQFHCGGKHDFLRFLQDVITVMISRAPQLNKVPGRQMDNVERLVGHNHFPTNRPIEATNSKTKSMKKTCHVCYARGIRTARGLPVKTNFVCSGCSTQPGLCVGGGKDCFEAYHTKLDFSTC